jgi:hypothetical protein
LKISLRQVVQYRARKQAAACQSICLLTRAVLTSSTDYDFKRKNISHE